MRFTLHNERFDGAIMPLEISSTELSDALTRIGAFDLDLTLALRNALLERDIGGDFLRFAGTYHGKMALDSVCARLAHTYQVSLAGASKLFQFLRDPGTFITREVPEDYQFDPFALAELGVVEVTASFRTYFPTHFVPARPAERVSPYVMQCAARFEDVILACGARPYADCHMLCSMLSEANQHGGHSLYRQITTLRKLPILLTTRFNLFCMLNVFDEPCIVQAWNHDGWHLDAFRSGDYTQPLQPGCGLFVPVGVRNMKAD